MDYGLFQAEHGCCQISLKRTVLPVSLPAKPKEGISEAMISRIEAFSMLQNRAQQAEHPVSANTRPPIASVADATPQVYQSRRPEITVVYQLPKPLPNGQTQLHLKPEEFLDRLAMLLPRPGEHRHSYHGVLAANARLRKEVVAPAGLPINEPPKVSRGDGDTQPQPSDEQGKAKDTDGQKGFGGFKDVVSPYL